MEPAQRKRVIFDTAWASQWKKKNYFTEHPVITTGAAQLLVDLGCVLVGVDFPSVDQEPFETHQILLGNGLLIVENLTKSPWKSYVLAEDEGSYMIAGGASQGIEPGDTFAIYQRGRVVTNPQTGAKIELPGKRTATVRVDMSFGDDSFSEVSMVSVVSGAIGNDFSQLYVAQE